MTETVEQSTIHRSPLEQLHTRLGATMVERDSWTVPSAYGDVTAEYVTVRGGGAGLIDISSRGRLLVGGSEAVQFLNGLITNDMKTLAENSWMPAAFPNVQGRLIASVRVTRLKDERTDRNVCPTYLLDTETATHDAVFKTIERFTFAGDFRVTDITNHTAQLTLQGRKAIDVAREVLGQGTANLRREGATQIHWQDKDLTVVRSTHTAEDGFDLILDANQASSLWIALLDAGALPVGHDALEILRIEAGIPRYGVDMDETNVVTETPLDDAVSYTKGCYVGQEIIARIKYRGHVARKLAGITFDQPVEIAAGAVIKSADDKAIGRITSAAHSPRPGQTIALGYLKFDYLATGTRVRVSAGSEDQAAQVTELPFVRGSWYEK